MKPQRRPSEAARKLLAALVAHPADWRHGYDLTKETGVGAGTLYPLLDRWASQGLLQAEWHVSDAPGRPARHAYRLTSQGVAFARSWPIESNIDVSLQPRTA
ncbi:MAG TPA: PadR family transcriptional regulator [Brevundimonas sp.]|nr:PadR family transcriptional regulator [Brevundimonas sp.]